jgi:hypothetical protein
MPLLRYFLFVGGTLIALLFAANAAFPTMPLPEKLASGSDLPRVRIHSDRKLPERVVFDTSITMPAQTPAAPVAMAQLKPQVQAQVQAQMPAPAPVVAQAPIKPLTPEMSAKARVREAFAQLPQEQASIKPKMTGMATVVVPEPKFYPARQPVKQKTAAKPHPGRPMMIVAQQPRFGGMATW